MVAPTYFGITLPSSGSVPSAFWEMHNWGAVDRILWMGVLCLVTYSNLRFQLRTENNCTLGLKAITFFLGRRSFTNSSNFRHETQEIFSADLSRMWSCNCGVTVSSMHTLCTFLSFFLSLTSSLVPLFVVGVDHTQWHTHTHTHTHIHTLGRTPLDGELAVRRELFLTLNTQNWQTTRPSIGFETANPACQRPQTHALNQACKTWGPFQAHPRPAQTIL
jgi:hypothetical protein